MTSFFQYLVEKRLVILLVTIFIILLGIFSLFKINREAFPNVNLDKVQIGVRYPGESPQEIERLINIPIEQELKSVDGLDKVTSIAFPGSSQIVIELDPLTSNRSAIVNNIQLAVNRAVLPTDLPSPPNIVEIDGKVFPVIQVAITAPLDELALKQLGDKIEDDLLNVPGVAKIQRQGERKAEISVVVKPQMLQKYRITIGEISQILKGWNVNSSSGTIDTVNGIRSVRVLGEYKSAEDVKKLFIKSNEYGQGITLSDIADVSVSLEKASIYHDVSGQQALHFLVLKQQHADIITTVDLLKEYLQRIPETYGSKVEVKTFEDFSRFARLRLGVLSSNAVAGLILVLVILALFLRPSVALASTISLPTVVLGGIAVIYFSGITLNLISMMGFIIVLGMLVDDSVMFGENIAYHMEQDMAPSQAAVKGTIELLGPVLTTVTTTVVAFIPMLFMSGIIGKFIIGIPIVVITLLLLSLMEAVFFLPSHVAHMTRAHYIPRQRRWINWLEVKYQSSLELALRYKYSVIIATASLFFFSILLIAPKLSFQLFPPSGIEQFIVRVSGEHGVSLEKMRDTLRDIDKVIRKDLPEQHLESTLITTGQMARDSGDPLLQRNFRFGQIRVIFTPASTRPDHDALEDMRKLSEKLPKKFNEIQFAFEEIKPGPPTGRALQVEISAREFAVTESTAIKLAEYLTKIPGITSIESDIDQGDRDIHVIVNKGLAAYAGVDLDSISSHLRAAVDGLRVSTLRWGNEEVYVNIKLPQVNAVHGLDKIKNLQVQTRRGSLVMLQKIAKFEEFPAVSTVRRQNNQRVINVMANVDTRVITSYALNTKVRAEEKLWTGIPAGSDLKIHYGGENEKNEESARDLVIAFGFALIAIFFILAIMFNNLAYPVLVMLAIPFGIVGVIWGLYIHDILWKPMPLSFMSIIGVVALSGVVVNNSLVMLAFIQRNLQDGLDYKEAVITGCVRRLRPILITTITTFVGLLPTAYGFGGLDPLVSPLALSLVFGLLGSTVITLIAIPAVFMAAAGLKRRRVTS